MRLTRLWKLPALGMTMTILTACQTATSGTEVCGTAWVPICASRSDTPGTLDQVERNNRAWESYCGREVRC